jgi:putative endopeptidase
MNPQTVNAYYEPSLNVIVFPAAILQPPFFDPQAEDAVNYGGIGTVIGHEIGHGFDDQGSKYDGDGKLNDWWTAEDRKNFEVLTSKLIEQYNAFVPSQLAAKYADEPGKAPHVNGALTIGENIGDLSGVNIALKAYAFALDEAAGRDNDGSQAAIERTLGQAPSIDGFTGLQRFFLGYASVWRSTQRDELAEQYLQIDPHSPAECRTNGITRNVDLFYTEQRVHIW